MSSERIHGIVIYASKFSDPFAAIARTATGAKYLIKKQPPAGVYYTPPTVLSFQASGSSASGPDGMVLPVADSIQLVTAPLSNEIAPFIKGVVRKSYDAPGRAHLYIDYNEDITVHTSHRPRIYPHDLVGGSYAPYEGANILFTTHSVRRGDKRYNHVHCVVPDLASTQMGRACIAPPELVKHLHSTGHDIFIGAFDDNDDTIADHPIFTDVDIKYKLPKGSSLGKLTLDNILTLLNSKYAVLEKQESDRVEQLASNDASADLQAQASARLNNISSCRRHLRDIGKNKPSIAVNLTFLQKGYTGATHASFTTAEIAQWVGSFCNKSPLAESIRRVTLIEPAHHHATQQNLYELHPPEENHFYLRGAPNRLVGVTLTDMVHLGTYDPDAKPPSFDFTHSTRLTRLQLLEFRGGSAPLVGPHPRSPPITEVTLCSDDMDESASSGEAREASAYTLAHSLVYSVATDKRKMTTDITYPLTETLAGYSSTASVSSHQYTNYDATFQSSEELESALRSINQYGLGVACGMRAELFYSHQKDAKEPAVFNLILGSGGAKVALDKLPRLLPGAQFVFLTNYVVRVHSPKLHIHAVIKNLARFHDFERKQGERPILAALASDVVKGGVHYFTPPRQQETTPFHPRRSSADNTVEESLTNDAFLISGAERAFSSLTLRKLVGEFVPLAKDSPGAVSCRWVAAPSGESFICVKTAPQLVAKALAKKTLRTSKRLFHARPYSRREVPIEGCSLFGPGAPANAAPLIFPQVPAKEQPASANVGPDVVTRFFEHMRQQAPPKPSTGRRARASTELTGDPFHDELEDDLENLMDDDLNSPDMPPPRSKSKRRSLPLVDSTRAGKQAEASSQSPTPSPVDGATEGRDEDPITPSKCATPRDDGTGLGLPTDPPPSSLSRFCISDLEDELIDEGNTPAKNVKRKGTPDKPSTPAKRKEGGARPSDPGSLRNFFDKGPSTGGSSPSTSKRDSTQQKHKNKSQNSSKAQKQRLIRKK